MGRGFEIGNANADEQEWEAGRKAQIESFDPVATGLKAYDFTFLNELLKPLVEKKLRAREDFADREDLVQMLTPSVVSDLQKAYGTAAGVSGTFDQQNLRDMQFRFGYEFNLIVKAAALRNSGKGNEEILEILKAEIKTA